MGKRGPVRTVKKSYSNGRTEPSRQADVYHDADEGLGRAHQEDFLGLEDQSDLDSDEEDENPVLDVQGSDSDDDVDESDDEPKSALEVKMSRRSKVMKQRAFLEEVDDEDEDEENEERETWGKSKKKYYGADNADFETDSDDEDAPAEEEAEAIRLQKKAAAALRPEDYEQDAEGFETEEKTLEEMVGQNEGKSSRPSKPKASSMMDVEEVKKDVNALSKEEKLDVVMSDAPELVGLLAELREALDELRNRVQPLVEQVKAGQYATKDGISYLEVKHLLLLSYCQSIVFYLMLKAEGRSVRDHPVIARLVELRFFMEKIRPIDKKLQYQIDKLLKATSEGATESHGQTEDALKYRPNPDLLVSKLDEQAQAGDGLYRPPKIAPVAMSEDKQSKDEKRRERAEKENRRRASRSAYMREIANELEGKPEEVHEVLGTDSKEMMREKAKLDARAKEEEELFARIPLSKVERKKLKKLKQPNTGLMDLLDDFDDGLADLVGAETDRGGSQGGPPDDLIKPKRLSQIMAESGRPPKKQKMVSGDDDVLTRDDLGERRRKHDMRGVKTVDTTLMSDDDQDALEAFEPEEDDVYQEAKQLAQAKKAAKSAKYDRAPSMPSAEEEADGKRHITNMMEKNRGLVPHRKKLTKNPRKKYKLQHGKAVIRQKGQVRSMRAGGGSYGGEATGVRTNLSRSVRFQN